MCVTYVVARSFAALITGHYGYKLPIQTTQFISYGPPSRHRPHPGHAGNPARRVA